MTPAEIKTVLQHLAFQLDIQGKKVETDAVHAGLQAYIKCESLEAEIKRLETELYRGL